MNNRLVECIPNFSEGRNLEIIQRICEEMGSIDNVAVLDTSSDHDHNRTVVTMIGDPERVAEAMFLGISTAAQLIDLNKHQGVHPRIGATDVVPFVPLRGISMAECVDLAHGLGRRVGEQLGIPVYFYEQAALREDRRNLADVRRYPYEMLQSSIVSDPTRKPDVGSCELGTAGAVVIGARGPLIAFNAFLDTDNVSIAKLIASQVRAATGGLPYLKALGFLVNGQAQVSMNVIDFRQTSLHDVLEAVRDAGRQHGVSVTHTELVGLVPRDALVQSALAYLGLPQRVSDLLLENHVGSVTGDFRDLKFE